MTKKNEKTNKLTAYLQNLQKKLEENNKKKPVSKTDKAKKTDSKDLKKKTEELRKYLFENKLVFGALVAMIIAFGAGYFLKGYFLAATVNGTPITRANIRKEAEKAQGKAILENKITETLIFQQAKKENVTVSEEELNNEISEIENTVSTQGQTLEALLALQGMTREDLEEQIKLQLIVEKLLSDKVAVSDEEVSKYVEDNAEMLPEDFDVEENKEAIRDQLKQQKLSTEFQAWLEKIKADSIVEYHIEY